MSGVHGSVTRREAHSLPLALVASGSDDLLLGLIEPLEGRGRYWFAPAWDACEVEASFIDSGKGAEICPLPSGVSVSTGDHSYLSCVAVLVVAVELYASGVVGVVMLGASDRVSSTEVALEARSPRTAVNPGLSLTHPGRGACLPLVRLHTCAPCSRCDDQGAEYGADAVDVAGWVPRGRWSGFGLELLWRE